MDEDDRSYSMRNPIVTYLEVYAISNHLEKISFNCKGKKFLRKYLIRTHLNEDQIRKLDCNTSHMPLIDKGSTMWPTKEVICLIGH